MARGGPEKSGGSSDKAPDLAEERRKRKAFVNEDRGRIGALAISKSGPPNSPTPSSNPRAGVSAAGEFPEAPTSIGQIATPSVFGREPAPSNPDEFDKRVQRNSSFLQSPETRAALLQFGVSLMSTAGRGNIGSNIGQALGQGVQAAGRIQLNEEASDKETREADLEERKVKVSERSQDFEETKFLYEAIKGKKANATEITKLLDEASDREAAGDAQGASLLRSRAFQLSQEFSLSTGEVLKGGYGNVGIAPEGKGTEKGTVGGTKTSPGGSNVSGQGDLRVEAIPGGKRDREQAEADEKTVAAKASELQKGMLVNEASDSILSMIESTDIPNYKLTGLGSLLQYIPGTDAMALSAQLDVLKSNVGFDQLQAMRDASPTGGALGPVSDTENRLLQSTQVALAQGQNSEVLKQSIRTIKFLFNPQAMEERNQIAWGLKRGDLDENEAINKFNELYRSYVFPPEQEEFDLNSAPDYLSDEDKDLWQYADPEQKMKFLNDDDRKKLEMSKRGM